jgi:hypothetical protein
MQRNLAKTGLVFKHCSPPIEHGNIETGNQPIDRFNRFHPQGFLTLHSPRLTQQSYPHQARSGIARSGLVILRCLSSFKLNVTFPVTSS